MNDKVRERLVETFRSNPQSFGNKYFPEQQSNRATEQQSNRATEQQRSKSYSRTFLIVG